MGIEIRIKIKITISYLSHGVGWVAGLERPGDDLPVIEIQSNQTGAGISEFSFRGG
jgi:hypothetical protein